MSTALRCIEEFGAWGHQYVPGQVIPPAEYERWPEGDLGRRIEGKHVEFSTTPPESVKKGPSTKE